MLQRFSTARTLFLLGAILASALLVAFSSSTAPAKSPLLNDAVNGAHWRHPVAQAITADGRHLLLANERSGSVSIVDLDQRKLSSEQAWGKSLADLDVCGDGRVLLVDSESHSLTIAKVESAKLHQLQKLTVSRYPVDIAIRSDDQAVFIASLWSRRISEVAIEAGKPARVLRTLDMPIAPRRQLILEDRNKLLVADSFSGRIAIVDLETFEVEAVRDFPGHNIRGFARSPNGEMLLLSHQMLNELAHTVRSDVHWGLLMSNDLRWLNTDVVLDPKQKIYSESHMHPLGEAGSATGDPARLAVSEDGVVVVTLAGVDEIAIGREKDFSLKRVEVGVRPTSVVIDDVRRLAYVANTFGDNISVLDIETQKVVGEISLGETPELTQLDRGERLFFSARLSHDSWMSCNSCHTDGHTNNMLNDNLSDKTFGAPKRVLSLLGKQGTEPLAWNASAKTLQEQVRNSIVRTMQKDEPPTEADVEAIAAFVSSLKAPPPLDVARGEFDAEAVKRGRAIFAENQCAQCHKPPFYTTPKTYDVGLYDKVGTKRFNPPTLIGVGQRGPYFHDNRAKSLDDVFNEFRHQLERKLTPQELSDLTAFLRSL